MPSFPFDWFHELENVGKVLKTSDSWNDFFGNVQNVLTGGPRTFVNERKDQIQVVIEAPGLRRKHQWSYRLVEQTLYLKGMLQHEQSVSSDEGGFINERHMEQFTRVIALPAPVYRKPISTEYDEGLLILTFEKYKRPQEDEWIPIRWGRK